MASSIDIGIALALNSCVNGVCPQPAQELGSVLYAGPWNPDISLPGVGFYQNFTFQLSQYQPAGQAIFTLTHFFLAGVRNHFGSSDRGAEMTHRIVLRPGQCHTLNTGMHPSQ
jgi:hypothetical protein